MRTPVEWNDASFMNHLLKERDVAGRLNDLCAVAVDHRQNRSGNTASNTTNVEAEIFPGCRLVRGIVVAPSGGATPTSAPSSWSCRRRGYSQRIAATATLSTRSGARLSFRRQRWCSSIGRIDDERCLPAWTPCTLAPMAWR